MQEPSGGTVFDLATSVLAGTEAFDALQAVFTGAGRDELLLREQLLAVGKVAMTLRTPPGEAVSRWQNAITLVAGEGVQGDAHAGSVTRVGGHDALLRRLGLKDEPGTNLRHVSLVSVEDGTAILRAMGYAHENEMMPPGLQTENIIIVGIPAFSDLPPGRVLTFLGADGERRTAGLHITAQNAPCGHPHANIVRHFGKAAATSYKLAAEGKRGLVAAVRPGGKVCQDDFVLVWARA